MATLLRHGRGGLTVDAAGWALISDVVEHEWMDRFSPRPTADDFIMMASVSFTECGQRRFEVIDSSDGLLIRLFHKGVL